MSRLSRLPRCPTPAPLLLDCDPGHDDAVAILLAAGRPDAVDLRAVTTVGGNAELEKVTLNARRVLTLAGVTDVPVAAGAAGPRRGDLITALDVHGQSGLDGAELPEPAMALDPRGAVELMIDRGPATVVATGPLTNVAALLEHSAADGAGDRLDGRLDRARQHAPLRRVQRARRSRGRGDRLLQRQAAHHGGPQPDPSGAGHARGASSACARWAIPPQRRAIGWLSFFADTYRTSTAMAGPPVHDACALALMIDPAVLRSVDTLRGHRDRRALDARGDGRRPPWAPRPAAQREGGAWSSTSTRFWAISSRSRDWRVIAPWIVVVGSINLDLVVAVEHHPMPGETVLGGDRSRSAGRQGRQPGGRRRAPGRRRRAWSAASEPMRRARRLREGLADEGVDVEHVIVDEDAPSGMALIAVDGAGENTIVVSSGANAHVGASDVAAARDILAAAPVTLLQHEVPVSAVEAAIAAAGGTVVLNPAPARPLGRPVDVLVPNRGELAALTGRTGDPETLARGLGLAGAVVVTLGKDGVAGRRRRARRAHRGAAGRTPSTAPVPGTRSAARSPRRWPRGPSSSRPRAGRSGSRR